MSNVLMIYALRTGWCALDSVDTEIKHFDNRLIDHDMVPSLSHNIESQTHTRVSECDGRPSVQVESSSVNRMVTPSAGVQTDLSKVVHSSCRFICHSSEQQTSTIRVSSPRPKCLGIDALNINWSHCLCLPSDGSPSQGDPKSQTMPLPDHRNSPRLARDAMVLGPSAALNRDPTATSGVNNSSQAVPQLCVPQQSTTSQPPSLVSRSGQLQEQGLSVEVAERIAAPQRSSTRTIYKSKWALFERACFHRDRPKSSRNLLKWNLSVFLNEFTKAPFEPMKDRPQTSYSQNCFLASFGLCPVPHRNPCLGCKQSI